MIDSLKEIRESVALFFPENSVNEQLNKINELIAAVKEQIAIRESMAESVKDFIKNDKYCKHGKHFKEN
jgi:hypothetical protein